MSYQYPTLENYPVYSSNSFDEVGDPQGAQARARIFVGDNHFVGGQGAAQVNGRRRRPHGAGF